MSKKVRFTKNWNDHKKGDVTQLREREFDEAIRAQAVSLDTAIDSTETETKTVAGNSKQIKPSDESSSDGNPQGLRTHNRRRR